MAASAPPIYLPLSKLDACWRERFADNQSIKRAWAAAPGRVNLIGEHTDYHGGFVMPAAIDLKTYVWAAPRKDNRLRCYSINLDESFEADLDHPDPEKLPGWARYIAGAAWALRESGFALDGIDVVVWGMVPFGGGLSSSASVEIAFITLWEALNELPLTPRHKAEIGQLAENKFVGVPCGIMDQFASSACKAGHALKLDCRSLETESVVIPDTWRMVVCDTGVRHELASSEYAKRQAECGEGVKRIQTDHPDVELLRDVTDGMLDAVRDELDPIVYRRCRYALDENSRVHRFANALRDGNADVVGEVMAAGHAGLRDDYSVSCAELDRAVELANNIPGLIGARMTGGGFGGCTVNLVHAEQADAFRETLEDAYKTFSGGKGGALLLKAGSGAEGGSLDITE